MKQHFPVGFLGNSGQEEIIVRLTPAEVRDRLRMTLRDESFVEAMFTLELHYTGEITDGAFTMRPCRQPRGSQRPTLLGDLASTADGTRIRFRIEAETWILYVLLIVFAFILAAMAYLMRRFDAVFPFCFMPLIPVAILIVNSLFTRYVSQCMLRFFLELFEKERLA